MTDWLATTARTPCGYLALVCLSLAAFSALVCACAWIRHVLEREEDGPPDVHGDVPRIPTGARR